MLFYIYNIHVYVCTYIHINGIYMLFFIYNIRNKYARPPIYAALSSQTRIIMYTTHYVTSLGRCIRAISNLIQPKVYKYNHK